MVNKNSYLTSINNNSGKAKLPIILVIFVALITIFLSFLISKEKKTLVNKQVQLANLQKDLDLLDKILVEVKENKNRIKQVSNSLPASFEEVAFFISQVERIAGINNQKLEINISKESQSNKDGFIGLPISLKTSGSYSNFSNMLTGLAKLPYHTKISLIKIEEADGNITALIEIFLYLRYMETE